MFEAHHRRPSYYGWRCSSQLNHCASDALAFSGWMCTYAGFTYVCEMLLVGEICAMLTVTGVFTSLPRFSSVINSWPWARIEPLNSRKGHGIVL